MYHSTFRILLLFFLEYLVFPPAFGQHTVTDHPSGSVIGSGGIPYIQEKLYVHTDRETYISREILWFRIYYVNALNNEPVSISKMAYVEILDKNNLPVLQEKVSIKPGESDGSVMIPVNIPSGMYKFRAYTNWMKNFDPGNFFEKPICILHPQDEPADSALAKTKRYDIQFFPEGGNLVQNIETKIGFRITDAYGKGLDCTGTLLNAHGDTLLKFHPLHMGLGSFIFKPAAGESYRAVIRFPEGTESIKELPASYIVGYVMNLSKTGEGEIFIQVHASPDMDLKEVYLIVHDSRSRLPGRKQYLQGNKDGFIFRPADLPDGISQFTLYNKYDQPVCERLYFKYPEDKLLIAAGTQPEYTSRGKIEINLSSTDQAGKPVQADMSLAVYRLDSLHQLDESDIRYYLYLTSYIGPVESPGYYFRDDGKSREEDMDNLMLTHGWRRYQWNDISSQKTALLFPPEFNGHIIIGKVTSTQTGAPFSGEKIYISVPSTRTQFRPTISDDNGNVKVEMPGFYGSRELIVQTDPADSGMATIEIASPFSQKYSSYKLPACSFIPVHSSSLLDQSIREQVQHIYSGVQMNQFVLQEVDTNTFYVVPDEKYMLDDYTRFLSMEEVLREYVHSSNVTGRKGRFNIQLVDKGGKKFFDQSPLILIDGVPFFDANELFQQDPKKIKRLDLVNREYVLGDLTFPGVLNATTYQGDLGGIQMNTHAMVLDYPGIPEQRVFFSPVYETEKQINSRKPDFRTLLFWSPELKSGEQGKINVNFYSSDLPGKYAIVVQGLTDHGEPGSGLSLFEVKK